MPFVQFLHVYEDPEGCKTKQLANGHTFIKEVLLRKRKKTKMEQKLKKVQRRAVLDLCDVCNQRFMVINI